VGRRTDTWLDESIPAHPCPLGNSRGHVLCHAPLYLRNYRLACFGPTEIGSKHRAQDSSHCRRRTHYLRGKSGLYQGPGVWRGDLRSFSEINLLHAPGPERIARSSADRYQRHFGNAGRRPIRILERGRLYYQRGFHSEVRQVGRPARGGEKLAFRHMRVAGAG
jgi:hypothetical protein